METMERRFVTEKHELAPHCHAFVILWRYIAPLVKAIAPVNRS